MGCITIWWIAAGEHHLHVFLVYWIFANTRPRIDTYGVRIITWARQILIVQIETGCTNYLQKAVIRAPREVQVAALYNLCIPAWRTEDSRSLASIDAFMDSLFQQLFSASIPQFKSPDVFHAGMLAALTFRYSKNMTRVQDQSSQFIECVQLTAVLHHRPLMKSILSSIASIGFRLRSEERHVESLCAFRTAYAVHSRPFDADSRECLETLYGLASSLQALGRFSEAQIYYERAMTGYEKIFRSDYRDSLHAAYGLAETLRKRGQLSNTIISKRESLESYEHMWDANYEDVVEAVFSFTEDLPNHTHVQEADAHYRHALEGYERIRGAHNIETLDAVFGLAASLRLQGRFTQADPSYLRAHNGFKKQLSNDHRKALRVAAGLQECLEHQRPMVSLASKGERVDPD